MSVPYRLAGASVPWRRRVRRLTAIRPSDARGLLWARGALHTARRQLDAQGTSLQLTAPGAREQRMSLPVLEAYLRLRAATCLERTYVLQSFLAAHGIAVPVVVGVRTAGTAVEAHAWLEGYDPASAGADYREITRIASPAVTAER